MKLVNDANGKMYSMKSGQVVTNWDRMESELAKVDVDVEHVKDIMVKLTETMSMERRGCGPEDEDELELHERTPLGDPVVSWDLPEQWDDLTGEVLDTEKVVKVRTGCSA